MGRRKISNRHLPSRMTFEHGAYYFRGPDRKRVNLGRRLDVALTRWARLSEAEPERPAYEIMKDERYVYVAHLAGSVTPVKIGIAANVRKRVRNLQTAHHQSLRLRIAYLFSPASRALDIERLVHKRFETRRSRGEWFDVPADEVSAWIELTFCDEILFRRTEA